MSRKVVKPGETLIKDCLGQVIKNYPYQNRGVVASISIILELYLQLILLKVIPNM